MNNDIDILYQKCYVGRIVFVIIHKGKVSFVYKRSGFNEPSQQGEIIPFMYLNTRLSPRGEPFGYIFKEYLYEGQYKSHRKKFPTEVQQFLGKVRELVKDIHCEITDVEELDSFIESDDFKLLVNKINRDLRAYDKEFGMLDYGRDI